MIKSSDDRKQYLINRLREIIAKKNGKFFLIFMKNMNLV